MYTDIPLLMNPEKQIITLLMGLLILIFGTILSYYFLDDIAIHPILTMSIILGAFLIDRVAVIKYTDCSRGILIRFIVWLCAAVLLLLITIFVPCPIKIQLE
jgi:hypothetical protein